MSKKIVDDKSKKEDNADSFVFSHI